YGGFARQGGGALSGKDPSHVDRFGAYVARYIARNVVAAGLARRGEGPISYGVGEEQPLAVTVGTLWARMVPDERIERLLEGVFPRGPPIGGPPRSSPRWDSESCPSSVAASSIGRSPPTVRSADATSTHPGNVRISPLGCGRPPAGRGERAVPGRQADGAARSAVRASSCPRCVSRPARISRSIRACRGLSNRPSSTRI